MMSKDERYEEALDIIEEDSAEIGDLKAKVERLEADIAGLTKMLDDSWYAAMPYLVKAVPPPDWITVVRAREDAKAGRVGTVDEIWRPPRSSG